ncbi:MAG TPA: hypothetical protein VF406_21500 [Thermodesulfobacteriota bacterium]
MATPANRLDQYRAQRLAEEEALLRAAPPEAFRQPPTPPTLGYDFLEPPAAPAPRLDRDIVPSASTTGTIGDLVEGPSFAVNRPSARPSAEVRAEQRRLAEAEALVPPIQQGVGAALLSKLFGRPVGLGAGAAVAARQAAVRQTARKLGTEEQKLTLERIKAVQEQQKELRDRAKFFQDTLAFAIKTFGNDAAAGAAHLQDVATNLGLQVPPEVLQGYYRLAAGRPETIGQLSLAIAKGTLPTTFATENTDLVKSVQAAQSPESVSIPQLAAIAAGTVAHPTITPEQAEAALRRLQLQGADLPTLALRASQGDREAEAALARYTQVAGQRAEATATGALRGGGLPASVQEALTQINSLDALVEDLNSLVPGIEAVVGPVAGRGAGILEATVEGSLTPQQIEARRIVNAINAQITYMLSGKQINEAEAKRLRDTVPGLNLPFDVFKVRLRGLQRQIRQLAAERQRLATTPAGQLPPTPEPPALSTGGAERRELNGRIYERRNGQWFDVTPEGR